jgi:hypothetical protein
VVASSVKPDGTCSDSTLQTSKTDNRGAYSITFPRQGTAICLSIDPSPDGSSTMYDEKSERYISLSADSQFRLTSIYPEDKVQGNQRSSFTISPFSRMLTSRIQYLVKQGNSDISKAHTQASKELVIRFGLNKGVNLSKKDATTLEVPELENLSIDFQKPDSPESTKFILMLATFSQLANANKKGSVVSSDDLDEIVNVLQKDFADGLFDGKDETGQRITVGPNKTPLS